MEIDRARLEEHYRDMLDGDLQAQLAKDLTELAREIALAEAARRGIPWPPPVKAVERGAEFEEASVEYPEIIPGHGPLRVCGRYTSPVNAEVLAARPRSEGVLAHVMDSDTIYANGALFWSLPLGGVRVLVHDSDLELALRIRASCDQGEFAIDEDFDVGK